jgi:novel protein kinase C delta type
MCHINFGRKLFSHRNSAANVVNLLWGSTSKEPNVEVDGNSNLFHLFFIFIPTKTSIYSKKSLINNKFYLKKGCDFNFHHKCCKNAPNNCGFDEKTTQTFHKIIKKVNEINDTSKILLTKMDESEFEELKNAEIAKLFRLRFQISPLDYEKQESMQTVDENNNKNSIQANSISSNQNLTLDDFNVLKLLGEGSFGKVLMVNVKKNENAYYAMKCLRKDHLLQHDELDSVMLERDICKIGHKNPYLVKLLGTFQNEVS